MAPTPFLANGTKSVREQLAKFMVLAAIPLGLFAFLQSFSPVRIFEPQSMAWTLWFSYANDLLLPCAFYFLLCLGERWLRPWRLRAMVAFVPFVLVELSQLLYYRVASGHYVGSFDLVDIFMYIISVGLAVVLEQKVFSKLFKFW